LLTTQCEEKLTLERKENEKGEIILFFGRPFDMAEQAEIIVVF
jgi:hypothetical protein